MGNLQVVLCPGMTLTTTIGNAQNTVIPLDSAKEAALIQAQVNRMVSDWNTGAFKNMDSYATPDGIDRVTNRTRETDDLLLLVYVKKDGTWLLTAGQNIVIDPKAAKSNPISDKRN